MNTLLDVTGHFLYLAVSIILLPVFVALDIFLGAILTVKFISRSVKKLHLKAKHREPLLQMGMKKSLLYLRAKAVRITVNQ